MDNNSDFNSPIYVYDGSFDGLLCCVFASYTYKEMPSQVEHEYNGFLPTRNIQSTDENAQRVRNGIFKTMGSRAFYLVKHAYLSERDNIELNILKFLKLGFTIKQSPHRMIYEDCVKAVTEAAKYTLGERHLSLEFLRFSESNGILTSVISPKANILPLLAGHFIDRFPRETFLIYDSVRQVALVYSDGKSALMPLSEYVQPAPDENEQKYRRLFTLFYNTIEVKPRHNERCRMNHMPKRFWKNMTEFLSDKE